MKNSIAVISVVGLALSACASPKTVDFNGHSVKIQTTMSFEDSRQTATIEAQAVCSKVGKRAEYASTKNVDDFNKEHLFLCI